MQHPAPHGTAVAAPEGTWPLPARKEATRPSHGERGLPRDRGQLASRACAACRASGGCMPRASLASLERGLRALVASALSRDECFAQLTRAALRQLCRMLLSKPRDSQTREESN